MSIAHRIQVRTAKRRANLYIQGYDDGRAGRPPQMEPPDDNRRDQDDTSVRPPRRRRNRRRRPYRRLVELISPMGYYSVAEGVPA